jgi:hypothetical protein
MVDLLPRAGNFLFPSRKWEVFNLIAFFFLFNFLIKLRIFNILNWCLLNTSHFREVGSFLIIRFFSYFY